MKNVIICFKPPEKGSYIGGFTTLCNDYLENAKIFEAHNILIKPFYYQAPKNSFYYKSKNSIIKNIIYGVSQCKALRKFLKDNPKTSVHIHTSRKWLFIKDVLLALMIRKLTQDKIIFTIHVGDIETVFHNNLSKRLCIRLMNKCVDKTLFLSAKMRLQFIDNGLIASKSAVLYNFYNVNRTKFIKNNAIPQIVYLGSINKEKGILELLKAVSLISIPFQLHICGSIIEESIREPFESHLKQLKDKVLFHGYINKEQKNKILQHTDILVLPSYREGLPISILEAMANSCAIITTPVGAIPEILDEKHAIFITPANIIELKLALEKLLTAPTIMQEMQEANYVASAKYQLNEHIRQLCLIYNE